MDKLKAGVLCAWGFAPAGIYTLAALRPSGLKKSMQAGLPIVPVTVTGSYALFPPKQRFIRPGTMCVEIGNPIEVTRFTLEDRDRLLQRVRAVIQGNLDRQSPMAALNTPGLSRRGPASASPHPF